MGKPNIPFGGFITIMCRDFKQLPSISRIILSCLRGMNITSYLEDYIEANSPLVRPVQIFLNHTYVMHLTKQNRSTDKEHNAYLNKLWNGGKIVLSDIKKLYSKFDPVNDLNQSMDWMEKSVILVTKNLERILFTIKMAKAYAIRHNVPLVRWKLPPDCVRTPSNFSQEKVEKFLEQSKDNDSLYEHWVEGALGYITTNINTELGIANGSACRYHSLTFHDNAQKEDYNIQYNRGKQYDGSWVITLNRPPKAINVQLYENIPGNNELCNALYKNMWKENELPKLQKNKVVIPILATKNVQTNENNNYNLCVPCSSTPQALKIKIRYCFDVELRFEMTVDKAQGSTLDYVLIYFPPPSENNRNFLTYEKLFVAISRVKDRKFLKFICDDMNELKHFQKLKPRQDVIEFLHDTLTSYGNWYRDKEQISWCEELNLPSNLVTNNNILQDIMKIYKSSNSTENKTNTKQKRKRIINSNKYIRKPKRTKQNTEKEDIIAQPVIVTPSPKLSSEEVTITRVEKIKLM